MEVIKTSRSRVCCAGAVLVAALAGVSAIHGQAVYAQGAVNDKPISLNFQNAPVTTVLKTLFTSVGANYSIDPDVQGSVNIALNNVPFSAALHSLLRSANPPLTFDLQDGVYHIRVKKQTALATTSDNTSTTGSGGDTGSQVATTTDDRRWFKLPVDHSDVALILQYVGISKGIFVVPADLNQGRGGSMGGGMNGGMGGMNGGMGGMSSGMGGMSGGFGGMSSGMGGMSGGMTGMGGYGMR